MVQPVIASVRRTLVIFISLFFCCLSISGNCQDRSSVLVYLNSISDNLDQIAFRTIQGLGVIDNFNVDSTSTYAELSHGNLSRYNAVVFLNRNGEELPDQNREAIEAFVKNGNGLVCIFSAIEPSTWSWYDSICFSQITSYTDLQESAVVFIDRHLPASNQLNKTHKLTGIWANLNRQPRGNAQIEASLLSSNLIGSNMGYDHPVSWSNQSAGGRIWVTTLGSNDKIYRDEIFIQHLLNGIDWAANGTGAEATSTVDNYFEITVLDSNNTDPIALDIAPDGRVFFIEKSGNIKICQPDSAVTILAGHQPVFAGGENGLIGMALDPYFNDNPRIYLHYTFQDGNWGNTGFGDQRVSRFQLIGDSIDFTSEEILLTYQVDRESEIYSGGDMTFDANGNLFIATGDNTNYRIGNLVNQYSPIDDRAEYYLHDAQRSSGNSNDLRGKILRIKPSQIQGEGYTVPGNNLFDSTDSTRAEIYIMGLRNPFKLFIDNSNNLLYWADVGPDALIDDPDRGPIGRDEFNRANEAGNYGWPYFLGDNLAYNDYDFETETSGPKFKPERPENKSENNTGVRILPEARGALMWEYKVFETPEFPEFGSGNPTAISGPVYHFDIDLESEGKLPEYYDQSWFVMDWSRNWIKEVKMDKEGNVFKINDFLGSKEWIRPLDMMQGPDGCLYLLEWGLLWGGAANPDSRISRICFNSQDLHPTANIKVNVSAGDSPLKVHLDASQSSDPLNHELSYSWEIQDATSVDTQMITSHTFNSPGEYNVILSVTNSKGLIGLADQLITVGNNRPLIKIVSPENGTFVKEGIPVNFDIQVEDIEDGSTSDGGIQCEQIENMLLAISNKYCFSSGIGQGCSGLIGVDTVGKNGGHEIEYYLFNSIYEDKGQQGLIGNKQHKLNHTTLQAENYSIAEGVQIASTKDGSGKEDISNIDEGGFIAFEPINLKGIKYISFRYASIAGGNVIEIHKGVPSESGSLIDSIILDASGSLQSYITRGVSIEDPGGTDTFYFVFHQPSISTPHLDLNWIEFHFDIPSQIDQNETKSTGVQFDLFPNPSSDNVFVRIGGLSGLYSIHLYDSNGNILNSVNQLQITSSETKSTEIATNDLDAGVYYVKLVSSFGELTRKLIVHH